MWKAREQGLGKAARSSRVPTVSEVKTRRLAQTKSVSNTNAQSILSNMCHHRRSSSCFLHKTIVSRGLYSIFETDAYM